MSFVGLPILR